MLDIDLMPSQLDIEFETNDNKLEFDTPQTNVNMDYQKSKNKPSINGVELLGNLTTDQLKLLYSKLLELPTINGKTIVGNLTTEDLGIVSGTVINLLHEFDIEKSEEIEPNDVYSAIAILELMEIFGFEITQIQEALEVKEDKRVYIELNLNFNPSTADVTVMNWITENPYQVADEANKRGKEVVAKGYLYNGYTFLETVFLTQTLYSDSTWGKFKYFLGFTDDITMAYLRLNASGSTTCGLKRFE